MRYYHQGELNHDYDKVFSKLGHEHFIDKHIR